jgi:hypothetical protein
MQNYKQLAFRPRSGNMRSGEVDIDDGAVVLQVRAVTAREIVISISTPPPCRRDG